MKTLRHRCLAMLVLLGASSLSALDSPPRGQAISLFVDATDSARKLFHSQLSIPARPGPLTLVYPKWIPGYHAPKGPINNIVGLTISAAGRRLAWERDLLDMFAFHVVVPAGADRLDIAMDVVAPTRPDSDLGAATAQLFVLEWNQVLLYPQGVPATNIDVYPRIRLPKAWKFGCALAAVKSEKDIVEFPDVSLAELVDSPLLSGKYFRTLEIPVERAPPMFLDTAADDAAALEITPEWRKRLSRLGREAGALFGGYPYREYHFLLALSDDLGNDGIEHQQSSDDRIGAKLFSDDSLRLSYGYLLPHEYAHAWNGKYRRPAGLATSDFQQPQTTELLWVYEGLTRYLNWVLAARAGILTPQEARDYAALLAAQVVARSGRSWRTLEDTAVSAQLLFNAPEHWESLRRSVDFYDESLFLWLEADALIRGRTQGKRSLDDFCRSFFAVQDSPGKVNLYRFPDVVAALNEITPYDWAQFFTTRLNALTNQPNPPSGLDLSGWKLTYGQEIGSVQAAREEVHKFIEERFSLGLLLQWDGAILDVVRDSPAWDAGLGPGMKVVAVNQSPWSPGIFRSAISNNSNRERVIDLTLANGSQTIHARIALPQGERYPVLAPNGRVDFMSDILKPSTLND